MKKLFVALILLATSLVAIAQPPTKESSDQRSEAKERIEASKVAYMTSYLNLTTKESEQFWPLYNEYRKSLKELRPEGKKPRLESLSDAEASKMLDGLISMEKQKASLKADYMQQFRKVISDRKVLLLFKAESEFKKQMVRRYADRKGGSKGKGERMPCP